MNKQFWILFLKLVGLIVVVILSFISFYNLDKQPSDNILWNIVRFIAPSLLFTIYAMILYHRNIKSMGIEVILIIYPLFYILSIIISLLSSGVLIPIMGGLGGILTKVFFVDHKEWKDKKSYLFGILGFIGPLTGLIFGNQLIDSWDINNKNAFGMIIGGWQLSIGFGLINALNIKPILTESDS